MDHPFFAVVAATLLKRVSEAFGKWAPEHGLWVRGQAFLNLQPAEAVGYIDRIFTMNLSFLVFTFGSLLVAIQIAGGQYTPRIIATTLLRDNVIRGISGLFVFTMLWSNRTLAAFTADNVPQFQVFLTALIGLVSVVAFLLLIDCAARFLRPVNLVARVGEQGLATIENVYPYPTRDVPAPPMIAKKRKWSLLSWGSREAAARTASTAKRGAPDRIVYHKGNSGTVLAVNLQALVTRALQADCVIELAPEVGDFLAVDEPLFNLYGNAGGIDDRELRALVALGSERTMEQDPMFAFRIEVDIALKALSPAINDPTTAVLAIDQLHRLLRLVGKRSLRDDEITDNTGQPRVIFHSPDWEDFVHITFREIRYCGAGSLQIARRLRAMIENLMQTLPEHRHPALREELELLDHVLKGAHPIPKDLALARIPDSQGLGGSSRSAHR